MPKHIRGKAYARPPQASDVLPGQQSLFGGEVPGPNHQVEKQRQRAADARIDSIERRLKNELWAIEAYRQMRERGVTVPDVAAAIGLPAPIERVTRPLKPWRLRAASNMDVIATMLENAGRKGVSEDEMVAELHHLGRLTTAGDPRRSVHWTVAELQKRTRFVTRTRREKGGRWYAYGRFDTWRGSAA
jgi:hypothetical protein